MTRWIDIAGWTLVHFAWQGALLGLLALTALRLLHGRSPQARYAAACIALAVMCAAPVATALALSADAGARARMLAASLPQAWGAPWLPGPPARPPFTTPVEARQLSAPQVASLDQAGAARPLPAAPRWLPLLVAAWVAGVASLGLRLAAGWWRIGRIRRASLAGPPSRWAEAAARVAASLGVQRVVRVVDSAVVDTPAVLGGLRPLILLPIAALANLSPAQIDAILAHELAHIRRHDFLVNVLQTLAETLLFYHPAVWWLSERIRSEREHCCDLVAVSVCGDAVSYAEALTELESWRTADPAFALAATGGSLIERIRRLLGVAPDAAPRSLGAGTIAAAAVLLVVSSGAAHYLRAAQPGALQNARPPAAQAAGERDPVAWRMVFNHQRSELNVIGYTGRDLIRYAYQIPKARVIGGPAWIDDETFRLVVNLDAPPAAHEMEGIIRRVLEERFDLRTHVETRDFPAYALTMARPDRVAGPNLRVSTIDCFDLQAWIDAGQPPRDVRRGAQRQPVCGEESWDSTIARTSFVAITMPQFASEMRGYSRLAQSGDAGRVDVLDRTGLPGRYDIDLHAFLPTAALMAHYPMFRYLFEPLGIPSMPRALEQQLGLRLEETTAPYEVIVIDHAERP